MSKRQRNEGEGPSTSGRQAEVVRVSKAMTKLLRHHPPAGTIDKEGWMDLPVLMRHLKGHPSEELVRHAVASNDKQRFVIDDEVDPPRIRATQGHSIQLDNPVLVQVTSARHLAELLKGGDGTGGDDPLDDQPTVVHVTGEEGWAAIQASGELRRMERMHVHFATRPHMVRRNKWAKVWLRLDLQGAIEAGHDFFLSTNQVLLTKGPIPILYVQQIDEKDDLPVEWRIERIEEEGGMLQRK